MPTVITLQHGLNDIETEEDPQALADRFDAARRDGTLVKVDTDDEDTIWINPHVLATITPHTPPRPLVG